MNNNEKKIKNLWNQIFLTSGLIFASITAILVEYNEILKLENKSPYWNDQETRNISIFNRIILLCVLIGFFLLTYESYEATINNPNSSKQDIKNETLSLGSAVLAIIIGFIFLYVTINLPLGDTSGFDDPEF